MFTRLLIANRGEIACRIARTARRMGIHTIAVYSDADAGALHVTLCDEAHRIGPPPARDSYLDAAAILAVARRSGAQAIHPGYGFLSENEAFALACADAGIAFVGPPAAAIAAMGSKSAAKAIMSAAGVPIVPGYHGEDQDAARLAREAEAIGWPVLVKATAGGGGKGMKIVERARDFAGALASAQREAQAAFGDARVLLEKYLVAPRHIEIQVFADTHGHAVHLFERDCSVQRRHQKVLEEATAPGMTERVRSAMGEAAVAAARAIGYVGAGTVEFIVPASFERDGRFHFMEMNTRLQVEHPVTEMITGLDLVEWQLRVAAGEPLPLAQEAIVARGHAIEARIYAEDPARGFLPSIGTIRHWRMPPEGARVRVDTGFRAGDAVTPYYDPMLAKLIAWGEDREAARATLLAALQACEVAGVATNLELLARIVGHDAFARAEVDTGFIERHRDGLLAPAPVAPLARVAVALAEYAALREHRASAAREAAGGDRWSPWNAVDGWWLGSGAQGTSFTLRDAAGEHVLQVRSRDERTAASASAGSRSNAAGTAARAPAPADTDADAGTNANADAMALEVHDGQARHLAQVAWREGRMSGTIDGERIDLAVLADGDARQVTGSPVRGSLQLVDPLAHAKVAEQGEGRLTAPMSGTIVAVLTEPGAQVERGAPLVVLEAMKMEHTIVAPVASRVAAVNCAVGERVSEGADLVDLAPADDAS